MIHLPILPERAERTANIPAADRPPAACQSFRVLVVDDNVDGGRGRCE